jgi:Putative outer membrane beta-barrel porin, MtrB/PioB
VDYGLEILYKDNDYTGDRQFLQRTKDKREEIYGSIGFGDPKSFRMLAFFDAELIQYESLHRVGAVPASGDPDAAPAGGPPNTSYTWSAKNRDHAYQVGLGADWLPNERWIVKSSAIWSKTNGSADFAAQAGTILQSPGLLGITNFDNSYKTSFNLKGTYKYTKNWDLSAGYAYERYRISDIGTDNYGYIAASTPTTQNSYASGLNAFNNYTMNILYMMVNYKFD